MNFDIANLLPDDVSVYSGFGFVRIVVAIFLALVVVRSCIHVFAQDGGAQRIAGVDTSVAGGDNVIAMFHQWGAVQLTLVGLLIVVYVRYPGLTPLVILTLALDPVTRAMASRVKKLTSTKTPPGARLNWPAFFVLFALLVLSLFE
ncbi:MAG: hypothetical protein EBQ75_05355 [Actinobacteria bacterium]|jgi:hypothetical protein|nr:hypothetical protein [Actinomycetota bacterium]